MAEGKLLSGVIATSLTDLYVEREQVATLLQLARCVQAEGCESKFEKLHEILNSPKFAGEKLIVFTEHRDTLDYLVGRLGGLGHTGRIAQIHGGMDYKARHEAVSVPSRPYRRGWSKIHDLHGCGGRRHQPSVCWIMINFDVPWNPARLEQRMGRIHRYGQKHDPVHIINLVSPDSAKASHRNAACETRDHSRVAWQRESLRFDRAIVRRRVTELYMEQAVVDGADQAINELSGKLTAEQVQALAAQERMLYGEGGDVKKQLPRLRADLLQEAYRRLLPGYVRQYLENAGPPPELGWKATCKSAFPSFPSTPVRLIRSYQHWSSITRDNGNASPSFAHKNVERPCGCILAKLSLKRFATWYPSDLDKMR